MNQISVTDLAALSNPIIIDVREPDEFAAGHAATAVNIPLGELGERFGEVASDQTVYLICQSGGRSGRATEALDTRGFDVVNVDGGTTAWIDAKLPTEN